MFIKTNQGLIAYTIAIFIVAFFATKMVDCSTHCKQKYSQSCEMKKAHCDKDKKSCDRSKKACENPETCKKPDCKSCSTKSE